MGVRQGSRGRDDERRKLLFGLAFVEASLRYGERQRADRSTIGVEDCSGNRQVARIDLLAGERIADIG